MEAKRKVTVVVMMLLCAVICLTSAKLSISGGQNAQLGWFPYMVGLKASNSPVMFCGGSLISPSHILTAAHCFKQSSEKFVPNLHVVLGRVDVTQNNTGVTASVDSIIVHPDFNPSSFEHDIAILKLSSPVQFSQSILPINLMPVDFAVGTSLTVTGFGFVDEKYLPRQLQYINIPLVDGSVCVNKGYHLNNMVQFCAGSGNGQDSCTYDSGGPAAVFDQTKRAWFQAGIISFGGLPCGGLGVVGTYTKVGAYYNWILKMMNGM